MATKLSNIRSMGRYENIQTGRAYNLKKGTNNARGTDLIFYLFRGSRTFISDKDFSELYRKVMPLNYIVK